MLGVVPIHLSKKLKEGKVNYLNRNALHNGDIIANSNENPMPHARAESPTTRKQFSMPTTKRLLREVPPNPTETNIISTWDKVNITNEARHASIDRDSNGAAGARLGAQDRFTIGSDKVGDRSPQARN